MFLMMIYTDPDELGEALAQIEDSRTRNGGSDGTNALATGVKTRGGGQGRDSGARRDRGGRGNARGRRDGKGHQPCHHQQQWASEPLVQYQQQWASQPPAQQQQPQRQQRQPQQQQQQRPPGHPSGWVSSRVCFRCGQPEHFYAECRAIPARAAKHMPPSTVHYPAGWSTGQLLCDFTWRLRVVFRENMDTYCPRRRPRMDRPHLPTRPGASQPTGL